MTRDIPKKPTRTGDEFEYHRGIRAAVIRRRFGSNNVDRYTQTNAGVLVVPPRRRSYGGGGAGESRRFKITGVSNLASNYLVCKEWDGSTEGDTVNVALPAELRNGTVSGTNLTRSVSLSGVSGTEILTPAYELGDEIWAIKPVGKTGVTVSNSELEWIDANVDARRFRFPLRTVEICVAGVAKRMLVYGGDPV